MAKRFTDTDKWKKPFVRGLQGPYKLLWLYILDDCDHAGVWHVDFEVARIRIGEQVDKREALAAFGPRVEVFADGTKWFLKDFIDFQYGQLSEKNRLHQSVINILQKNKLGAYKPLPRGQGQEQGQGIGQGQVTPKHEIIIGEQNGHQISIKPKYLDDRPVIIHDLRLYFEQKNQLAALIRARWTKFSEFMDQNPANVFEDDTHLYNAFKKFNTKPNETRRNTASAEVIDPDRKYSNKL